MLQFSRCALVIVSGNNAKQGQLELWVEMYDVKEIIHHEPSLPNLTRAEDITVELRVVIWEAQEMEEKDSLTQANDLYIKVTLQVKLI